jgi:predicted nucleic acid-binding protein
MNAVDTNILLYVHDPRDPRKQSTAVSTLRSLTEPVLLWQVACEYLAASRKLEPFGYNRFQAWRDIEDLRRLWGVVLPGWEVLERAQSVMNRHQTSYWDAMIIAACLEAGITTLYSEDLGSFRQIDGLEINNPF